MNKQPERGADRNDITAVAAHYARAARDALGVEDLLGHIPTVRTSLAAARVVGSVRDHLLLEKMGIFLGALASLPASDRRSMVERLRDDPAFNQDLGEHVIELLERLDGRRKPAMVGAVFAAYSFLQIDAKTLRRLNTAIAHIAVSELGALREMEAEGVVALNAGKDPIAIQSVVNAGMASLQLVSGRGGYALNDIGKRFLELELDRIRPYDA